jgi:hypothetical protein
MGKHARKKFSTSTSNTSTPLKIIHNDICRPFRKIAYNGAYYFVTFIYDYSRRIYLALIKTKDQVFDEFKKFTAQAENITNKRIKILHTKMVVSIFLVNFGIFASSQVLYINVLNHIPPEQRACRTHQPYTS